MAINDISLTSGMRANLTSLQSTVTLLNRTQQRLSSGKSVNSALDNPVNFFAAQSLNNRASDLAGYKDGMANAVQTIQAANQGVTSITTLLNAAKAVASAVAGKTGSTLNDTAVLTLSGVKSGDTVSVNNVTYTFGDGTGGTIKKDTTDALTAMNLATAINAAAGTTTVTSTNGSSLNLADSGADIAIGVGAHDVSAGAGVTSLSVSIVAGNGDVGALKDQWDSIMTQISDIAADSSYQGINLIAGNNLTVAFGNTHQLQITGTDASFGTLGLSAGPSWTGNATDGTTEITAVNKALDTLRTVASSLSNNLAIINARQDFSTNLTNVLQTGADNLTLADTNQEGANMLMLQTRQSLGTTALSLSSQAAQSVLRLFQ